MLTNSKSFALIDIDNDGNYLKLLKAVSKLSGLFSESAIPFIQYRVAENIFCQSFNAENLSRSDTAFDAKYNSSGIGIKTFNCNSNSSTEKVAEFNSLSIVLNNFSGKELAIKLSEYRNERIALANRLYDISDSLYHIIARKERELLIFETDYEPINIDNIKSVRSTGASLNFDDGSNFYSYNFSKSTLFRRFIIPDTSFRLPVEIIENPYKLLLEIFADQNYRPATDTLIKGKNYVILPLYGKRNKNKFIPEKSGLNQWNAGGRVRNAGEVYIPIPKLIHNLYPGFFPERYDEFKLQIPTGDILNAKVCQDNSKALMTNPNKALSNWLLRKVLLLQEEELATIEKLNTLGFDSVIIIKIGTHEYKIDIMKTDSYEKFIENTETVH